MSARRVQARVTGVVQGVGFRPHVHRLAHELGLHGFVLNDERGVLLEVEGGSAAVEAFVARLTAEPPPLAAVERIEPREIAPTGRRGFEIVQSRSGGRPDALVSADAATCEQCLAELRDPADRRYRYPFVNCTNCGPRFTIAKGVPYDRPLTTMAGFTMCAACQAEYEDPADRRFHAQPNACPECGPTARLVEPALDRSDSPDRIRTPFAQSSAEPRTRLREVDAPAGSADALSQAAEMLAAGAILAVKGIGGYHLACRADSEPAVAALRSRKRREERPFALMVASTGAARRLVELADRDATLLQDRARPIVIARRLPAAPVAPSVAPRCPDLGVMLPYAPLHHVLLGDLAELGVRALVMTSGNVSDEPIAYRDEDAFARLAGLADAFLTHDRPIHIRTDDSVLRATSAGPLPMRRSRGYVPAGIALPLASPAPLLAVGAELKSTFCLARGGRAWVSHHIGDLKNYETLSSFREGVGHFEALFDVRPRLVAHDLHPDYLSTRYAEERELDVVAVQHHHAHLAAVLAEHGEVGPAVGVIFDGSGFGLDGTVWGGELLVGGLRDFERAGALRTVRMPGGDAAVREPWRMACSWLTDMQRSDAGCSNAGRSNAGGSNAGGSNAGGSNAEALSWDAGRTGEVPALPATLTGSVDPRRWDAVARLSRTELAPLTSSAGRLFDAAAALCGLCPVASYEGQAAIELEGSADRGERGAYSLDLGIGVGIGVGVGDGRLELDPRPALLALCDDLARGVVVGTVAARFHNGLAAAVAVAAAALAGEHGLETVVLAGGVFQNRLLLEAAVGALAKQGLRPLVPRLLPSGDGAISYGQAAVAAARLAEG